MARPGLSIAVIGNCQAAGLAACLEAMLPEAAIVHREARPGDAAYASLATDFATQDWLVVQGPRRLALARLGEDLADRLVSWPRIAFAAYHPDIVYVNGKGQRLRGPLGPYHSALALVGWMEGLPVAETVGLFREDVYRRLGYLDKWDSARAALLAEAAETDVPIDGLLDGWAAAGCFMHTINHPQLRVIADLARGVVRRLGLAPAVTQPEAVVPDGLSGLVLPVYPEIADRLGLPGSRVFRPSAKRVQAWKVPAELDLAEMVQRAHAAFARVPREAIACGRLAATTWKAFARDLRSGAVAAPARPAAHPYAGLPDERFWRRGVEQVPPAELDPVLRAPFRIGRTTRIATAGSCFAQHIARTLAAEGFHHLVVEAPPPGLSPAAAQAAGYGLFSARYGNLYTARQLLQLFYRAHGLFTPAEPAWRRPDGRVVDPFRPQLEPDGFADEAAMLAARAAHLAAVREMFRRLEVFVFTLGLTEGWRSRQDGAVFPLAPGVAGGAMDPARHDFVNFTAAEVVADLREFRARLAGVNPAARMILTVSPVPLVATYEDRHVLVSTAASKAILRTAAEEVTRADPTVWYFPSYEVITGPFSRGRYVAPDLRSVTAEGVAHVMRLFFRHATDGTRPADAADPAGAGETAELFEVICDEEKLAG